MSEQEFNNWQEQEDYTSYTSSTGMPNLEEEIKANPIFGMIGAVIGSLVGVVVWVLIDMVGFIAGLSGVIMLLAAFKGYAFLGRKLDKFGTIFCIILSFVMIFVSVNLTLIMFYAKELGFDMVGAIGVTNILRRSWTEPETLSYIVKNLLVGYALYVWAGYAHIRNALKAETI